MKTSYFDRDTTSAIKGIALILMFVHHFFTFPSWLIDGIEYSWLQDFADAYCSPTDLCVGLFAFLTGYFYAFAQKKTYRYSLRKITDLLVSHWIIYIPFLIAAVLMGCYTVSVSGLVYEAFGLYNQIMYFSWYIYFYCIIMLLLPALTKLSSGSPVGDTLVLLIVPAVLFEYLYLQTPGGLLHRVIYNVKLWMPCVASGYLFAKHMLFERIFDTYVDRFQSKAAKILLFFLMCWLAFRGRYWLQSVYFGGIEIRGGRYDLTLTMDILYAPLFVYGAANLLRYLKDNLLFKVLQTIGVHSMLMWFIHCIFFNACREKTQMILYFPKNPVLVLINGLVLCYLAAALVNPLLKRILKEKNRLLDAFDRQRSIK